MSTSSFEIYPCTIFPARYGGAYEDASWIALNKHPDSKAAEMAVGDDLDCAEFFNEPWRFDAVVGKGSTPNEACEDLMRKLKK